MAFVFEYQGSDAALEAGVYTGWLVDIEEFDSVHGKALKWHFNVATESGEVTVTGVTSTVFKASSKAAKWAGAILRRSFADKERLQPAKLYSELCNLVVSVKELDDGLLVNRIDQVLPRQKAKPVVLATTPDGEPMDDDDVPF